MEYRVLIVEHDRLMIEKLSQVVKATPGFDLVARYQVVNEIGRAHV